MVMMTGLKHVLRAALVGFLTMFSVGALIFADEQDRARTLAATEHAGQGLDPGAASANAEHPAHPARGMRDLLGMGLFGSAMCVAALALLWAAFPVGPTSKIVLGVVCGPLLPLLLYVGHHLREGKGSDLAGIVVLGMISGALAGLLEANRVLDARRAQAALLAAARA